MNVPDDSLTPSESTVQHDAPDTETVAARRLSTSERAPFWSLRLHARETFAHSLVIVPTMYLLARRALGNRDPGTRSRRHGGWPARRHARRSAIDHGVDRRRHGRVLGVGRVGRGPGRAVRGGPVLAAAGAVLPQRRGDQERARAVRGAGVYALVAATNLGGSTDDQVGTATVLVALALMIAALVALFRFIGRLLDLMRPRRIYARLLGGFARAVEDVYPRPGADGIELRELSPAPVSSVLRHGHRNELLIGVDRARLVQAARDAGAIIEITAPIGSHVGDDAPILLVRGGSSVDPSDTSPCTDVRRWPAPPGGSGVRDPLRCRRCDSSTVACGQRSDERCRGSRCARSDVDGTWATARFRAPRSKTTMGRSGCCSHPRTGTSWWTSR